MTVKKLYLWHFLFWRDLNDKEDQRIAQEQEAIRKREEREIREERGVVKPNSPKKRTEVIEERPISVKNNMSRVQNYELPLSIPKQDMNRANLFDPPTPPSNKSRYQESVLQIDTASSVVTRPRSNRNKTRNNSNVFEQPQNDNDNLLLIKLQQEAIIAKREALLVKEGKYFVFLNELANSLF